MSRQRITPIQLFFLTLLYVYSGLSLSGADSLFALLVPFAATALWALVGMRGAGKHRDGLRGFLSAYMRREEAVLPHLFFLTVSAAQAVCQLFDTAEVLVREADFLSFASVVAVVLAASIVLCRLGMTALGRLSETVLLLLIPLVFLHAFGGYTPMDAFGVQADVHLLFSVLPAPVFFLLSLTVTAGDAEATDSLLASSRVPRDRARLLCGVVIGGAALAVVLRAFLLILPLGEHELLARFLEYISYVVKLALLLSLCTQGTAGLAMGARTVGAGLMALAVVIAVASLGGALYSPGALLTVLVSASAAAALVLALFSIRPPKGNLP